MLWKFGGRNVIAEWYSGLEKPEQCVSILSTDQNDDGAFKEPLCSGPTSQNFGPSWLRSG